MPRSITAHRLLVTQPRRPLGAWQWLTMSDDGGVVASGEARSYMTCMEQAEASGFIDPGLRATTSSTSLS